MSGSNALTFISHLDSVFSDDPVSAPVFRLDVEEGAFTWTVDGDTITVDPDIGDTFTATLSTQTIGELVQALLDAGFLVSTYDQSMSGLLAATLLDATGSANDPLTAYTSLLWSIGEAIGVELEAVGEAIDQAILCATLSSATSFWVDFWGSYFDVERLDGEADDIYYRRIVVEVLRVRCNNVAIEMALEEVFQQTVSVDDVREFGPASPAHDGLINFDGTHVHDAAPQLLYGLFDVAIGYDLLSGSDPIAYLAVVSTVAERLRAAGTHLRDLNLAASTITDTVPTPAEGASTLAGTLTIGDTADAVTDAGGAMQSNLVLGIDVVDAVSDTLSFTVSVTGNLHDGSAHFNAARLHNGGASAAETL